VPKAIVTDEKSTLARMEEVADRLDLAMKKVVANKGAPGSDGMTVGVLRERWPSIAPRLCAALLEGSYRLGAVRRVMISKAGGGQRGLGIPNVTDRVVMEAVRQVLEPLFEPTFHSSSHGFRPGRITGFGPAEVATRRSPRPRCMCAMDTSGWSTSIWRSSSIASTISA
jgi:retron-type reverse transcriptase